MHPHRGDQLYQEQVNAFVTPTYTSLDKIFTFKSGRIYELSSPSNDRHYLAEILALSALESSSSTNQERKNHQGTEPNNVNILWISCGGFDPKHIAEIVPDISILDRIRIASVSSHIQIMETTRAFYREMERARNKNDDVSFCALLVEMDPFCMIPNAEESATVLIANYLNYLRSLVMNHTSDLLVLLLTPARPIRNGFTGSNSNEPSSTQPTQYPSAFIEAWKPALDHILSYLVDGTIWLHRKEGVLIGEVICASDVSSGHWTIISLPTKLEFT